MAFRPFDIKSQTESEFIAKMVLESIKLCDAYNYEMKYKLLLGIVTHLVFTALKQTPDKPCGREELADFTQKNFAVTKHNVSQMVAGAFAQSMKLYSGKNIDYTCNIGPVKEDSTKPLMN